MHHHITILNLGRRTAIDNPDTGRTETVYDLASNITRKITAKLRAQGEGIAIAYHNAGVTTPGSGLAPSHQPR